jgi:hypothetical protein
MSTDAQPTCGSRVGRTATGVGAVHNMITQAVATGGQVGETRTPIARDAQSEVGRRIDHAPTGVDAVHGVTA